MELKNTIMCTKQVYSLECLTVSFVISHWNYSDFLDIHDLFRRYTSVFVRGVAAAVRGGARCRITEFMFIAQNKSFHNNDVPLSLSLSLWSDFYLIIGAQILWKFNKNLYLWICIHPKSRCIPTFICSDGIIKLAI